MQITFRPRTPYSCPVCVLFYLRLVRAIAVRIATTPLQHRHQNLMRLSLLRSESDFQQQPDFENLMRAEVRQTVSETVKGKITSWTIKGLAIEPYQNNVFWVAADIEKGR